MISYNDYKLGKNKGKGDNLFVESLPMTCLNVYKNPILNISYIHHIVNLMVKLMNLVHLVCGCTYHKKI